ncbi:hypothetical protein B14_04140 [Bacillus licheniformis]|uniref:Abortive infection family protein n=1 Tax=Bacillus paralicheniformis TaxID=1648923 RepID=A0AAW6K956_9BACI|nr:MULTISPECIES: abortive infection family protein [Bacillus subtilis group]ARC67103.1 hypothetical protein B14_04140 [Bacillus licheniformis]MDE1451862.1 abortive infection family protein [Bacillus paralicheniformis]MED4342892.1 abortive infection family protein [Bacillus licheniformis]
MNNNTVSLLDKCKNNLINIYTMYIGSNQFLPNNYYDYLTEEEYREARSLIIAYCQEKNIEVPNLIKECRSINELIYRIEARAHNNNTSLYEDIYEISEAFNPFIDEIELQNIEIKIINIECEVPQKLNYNDILDYINKCDARIKNGDYSGAITTAKTLIEGVCKEIIYNIEKKEYEGKSNLPKLFDEVRKHLSLEPKELDKPLKEVVSGLIKIIKGLNEIRNSSGDSHAGNGNNSKLALHHALLVVNSAKTAANFLFNTYEFQRKKGKFN